MLIHTLGLHAGPTQQPTLSPRLQQGVRLLQMSSLDFSQVVRDALDTNPFLEAEESSAEPDALGDGGADTDEDEPPPDLTGWGGDASAHTRHTAEDDAFDTLVAPVSLCDHLQGQLKVLPLPVRDLALAIAVVGSLDDDGYLRCPLPEVATAADISPAPEADELLIALRRVQALDPAGVGARTLSECLLLQLMQVQPAALRGVVETILERHLQTLGGHDQNALARGLGLDRDTVQAACAAIRRLDPRPGLRHGQAPIQYLTPDVVVRRQRGQWRVNLNPAVLPRLRLNQAYVELFQRHRQAEHAQLSACLQEAKWTLRNVEQRFATILDVTRAIVGRQHRFLVYGPMAMRPLALREIADEIGVHESTVSRVTNNKFVATPCGVFELKYFFSRGLGTASGGECSPIAIRGLMRELIAGESPSRPLSDVDIARQLAQQGLRVARRTVTKYRQQMKLETGPRRHPDSAQAIGSRRPDSAIG